MIVGTAWSSHRFDVIRQSSLLDIAPGMWRKGPSLPVLDIFEDRQCYEKHSAITLRETGEILNIKLNIKY
jgi:hypothetical protein